MTPLRALPSTVIFKGLADQEDKDLIFGNYKLGRKDLSVEFTGTVSTDGLNVSKFNGKEQISLGVELDDETLDGFDPLYKLFVEHINKNYGSIDDYNVTEPFKEDKIYVKIRQDPKTKGINVESNIPIKLAKPQDAKISRGQEVTVTGQFSVYLNKPNKTAGIYFTPKTLTFEK